jgi:hypothetical protein
MRFVQYMYHRLKQEIATACNTSGVAATVGSTGLARGCPAAVVSARGSGR